MKVLSQKQKAVLCQLATRAYYDVGASLSYADSGQFRHACVFDVTGKDGLTHCDQLDYVPVYNYFADLLNMPRKEDKTPRSALERAKWVLNDAVARYEIPAAYVAHLANARLGHKSPVSLVLACEQLGAEGVRQLTYTVVNRGRAMMRKTEAEHGLPASVEYHTDASTLPPSRLAAHFNCELAKPNEELGMRNEELNFSGLEPEVCEAPAEPYTDYEQ